ncbi:MAG: radical SAM protein [Bacteroidales bacterium]|nr:radical SAM protein [Bacteroidales bacterium]
MKKIKTLHNNLKSFFFKSKGNKLDTSNSVVKEYLKTKNKDRLCFAPVKNLFFGIDGTISSCYAQSFVLSYGKFPENTITQAWNSKTATNIRAQVENLFLPPACNLCYRQVLEKNFNVTYANVYDQHQSNANFPVSMEFYLDNTCNLECIMCSPENSSQICKKEGLNRPVNPYNDNFVNDLTQFIPHLKHTYFFGGEPFLIPIYYDIWEHIIKINPECCIDITTNGTILNDKVKAIIEKAKYNINISIDSLQKERFESIRKNADFDKVMNNLNFFHDYCKTNNTNFFISFCPMQQNWKEIPDILEFTNKLNAGLIYNRVWNPATSAIWTLSPQKLIEIIDYLEEFQFTPSSDIQNFNISGFSTLINQIKTWYKSALEFQADFTENISDKHVSVLIIDELKDCFKQNEKSVLSRIKNQKQLSERIDEINSIIDEYRFTGQEKMIFYRNIIMQKSFFINALFFAENSKKIRNIINLAIR